MAANSQDPLLVGKLRLYIKALRVSVILQNGTEYIYHGPANYAAAQRTVANIASIGARDMALVNDKGFSSIFIVSPKVVVETLDDYVIW